MRRLFVIPLILIALSTRSQQVSYKQFTVQDGLAGSVVYQALQDRKGFIWFATNQGVSRFDGKTFRNYNKEDGLPDNEIIKLYLDKYDNIWFLSFLTIPSVLYHDSIIRFDHCVGVRSMCEDPVTDSLTFVLRTMVSPKNGKFGYYRSGNRPLQWDLKANVFTDFLYVPILKATSSKASFFFYQLNSLQHVLQIKTATVTRQYVFRGTIGYLSPYTDRSFYCMGPNDQSIVVFNEDSIYYADVHQFKSLLSLKDQQLDSPKRDDVVSIFCESDSILWLCTRSRGLLQIRNFLTPHKIIITAMLPNRFCTSILKDRENGYWITTYNDGVYYLPNLNFGSVPDNNGFAVKDVTCIRPLNQSTILAGLKTGDVLSINTSTTNSQVLFRQADKNKNCRTRDIQVLNKHPIMLIEDDGLYLLPEKEKGKRIVVASIKSLTQVSDSVMFVATAEGIGFLNLHSRKISNVYYVRGTASAVLNHHYYFGTMAGLHKYISKDSAVAVHENIPILSGVINHLDVGPDSSMWVSTQQGLAVLRNDTVVLITKEQGLLSNLCKSVSFNDSTAWVATDKGVARIDYRWQQNKFCSTVYNITEEDGLLSNDVSQTVPLGNKIWVATTRGISFFDKTYISRSVLPPAINITQIMSDNKRVAIQDTVSLPYQQSRLVIELSGISYRSGKMVQYEYRLKELDSNWNRSAGNAIEFSVLPFGEFTFEVRAIDRWGIKSTFAKSIYLIHPPPFWKATWFLACSYLLLAFLTGSIFYFFYRNRQRKNEREYSQRKKIQELEMMALRAQMNPHFIFNCLASIQYHIIRSDIDSANLYLNKFSRLIRQTLQHSTASYITLLEEVRTLELYLELEKLRLGNRMDYKLTMDTELEQDELLIPSMIIQPFIENAIKHGIVPLQNRTGRLEVRFKKAGPYIDCFVEDNGNGIYSTPNGDKATLSSEHTSMGTNITTNRIETINQIRKQAILLHITDKQQSGLPGSGTIIHLSFPILND